MPLKSFQRIWRKSADGAAIFRGEPIEKMLCQKTGIADPIAQRRHLYAYFVDPVEKIFPESAIGNQLRQILMRRADNPYIHLDRATATNPLDDLILKKAQKLDLNRLRDVADFIEEQCAVVRSLNLSDDLLDCASEGASLVPEQLAFEQRLGNSRAAQWNERATCSRAERMDGVC